MKSIEKELSRIPDEVKEGNYKAAEIIVPYLRRQVKELFDPLDSMPKRGSVAYREMKERAWNLALKIKFPEIYMANRFYRKNLHGPGNSIPDDAEFTVKELTEYHLGRAASVSFGRVISAYWRNRGEIVYKRRKASPTKGREVSRDNVRSGDKKQGLQKTVELLFDSGFTVFPPDVMMGFLTEWKESSWATTRSRMKKSGWEINKLELGYWEIISRPEPKPEEPVSDLAKLLDGLDDKDKDKLIRLVELIKG